MSDILEGTPLKVSHDFMKFGRKELIDRYDIVKSGMTSTEGLVFYATPTITFLAMDIIKVAITQAVTDKDKVTEKKKIKALKDALRKNIPFVELHCNNDRATMLISGYKEAEQGGGPEIVIGATINFTNKDTGIVGEMKGKYKRPNGAKHVEGWSKKHSDPDTAWAITAVTDVGEIFWTGVPKGIEYDYKVRSGSARRKGAFSNMVTEMCRY